MNKVIDYVENNLNDEIDSNEISRIMACPFTVFQRSFIQITGIPLSEYIRRRKLTCAAYELQNTDDKVIDIALKYGYKSSDAFSVAFKHLHGAATWLTFEASGKISEQVLNHVWQRINQEFLPQSKYKKSGLPTIEKYVLWDDAADIYKVEIWIPVAIK